MQHASSGNPAIRLPYYSIFFAAPAASSARIASPAVIGGRQGFFDEFSAFESLLFCITHVHASLLVISPFSGCRLKAKRSLFMGRVPLSCGRHLCAYADLKWAKSDALWLGGGRNGMNMAQPCAVGVRANSENYQIERRTLERVFAGITISFRDVIMCPIRS